MMHRLQTVFTLLIIFAGYLLQAQSRGLDTAWKSQKAFIKNGVEAEAIIRLGDIDNLGMGWTEKFNPFCDLQSERISKLKASSANDVGGLDCILLSSKFEANKKNACGKDAWHSNYHPIKSKPQMLYIPCDSAIGIEIKRVVLQMYIYDVQSTTTCAVYSLLVNSERYVEGERLLNSINLENGIGRLINIPLNTEHCRSISEGKPLSIYLDENTGAPEGFAIDFVRLLINPSLRTNCSGNLKGMVTDEFGEKAVENASISMNGYPILLSNKEGEFKFPMLPVGLQFLNISKVGFPDCLVPSEVLKGIENDAIIYKMKASPREVIFGNKTLKVGQSFSLDKVEIDRQLFTVTQGSINEIALLASFLQQNPGCEIEITGLSFYSPDFIENQLNSYKIAKACKTFLVNFGIDPRRILIQEANIEEATKSKGSQNNQSKKQSILLRITKI